MIPLQTHLLTYALNALWQVPLIALAATLIASLAAQLSPSNPAAVRHRIWVGALLLQVTLPACTLPTFSLFHSFEATSISGILTTVSAPTPSNLPLPEAILLTLTLAYLASSLYFAIRLLHGLIETHSLLRNTTDLPLTLPDLPHARIATAPSISGPVTLGIYRPVLLVPPTFLESPHRKTAKPSSPTNPPTSAATTSPSTFFISSSASPSPSTPPSGLPVPASRRPARWSATSWPPIPSPAPAAIPTHSFVLPLPSPRHLNPQPSTPSASSMPTHLRGDL